MAYGRNPAKESEVMDKTKSNQVAGGSGPVTPSSEGVVLHDSAERNGGFLGPRETGAGTGAECLVNIPVWTQEAEDIGSLPREVEQLPVANSNLGDAVKAVREVILELCTFPDQPTPGQVAVRFASPAWADGFFGPVSYQSHLVEFYWDPYEPKPHIVFATRLKHSYKYEVVSDEAWVCEVRPEGIAEWRWEHVDSNPSQEITKRVERNGEVVAEYKLNGFGGVTRCGHVLNSKESGNEDECDRLYHEHIERPHLNTCLYRVDKGEVLVQHFFEEQLEECGAPALLAMAGRLREIQHKRTNPDAVLTPMPKASSKPEATDTPLPDSPQPGFEGADKVNDARLK